MVELKENDLPNFMNRIKNLHDAYLVESIFDTQNKTLILKFNSQWVDNDIELIFKNVLNFKLNFDDKNYNIIFDSKFNFKDNCFEFEDDTHAIYLMSKYAYYNL